MALRALILGAAILVWLSIIGGVISGIAVAVALNDASSAPPVSNTPAEFTDANGNTCTYLDAVISPDNLELSCP